MSLQTPTTNETSDLILSQFEASLSQSIPLLPKSFLRVLAKVMAGVFMLLYKYAGFIFLQMFVRTATYEQTTVNGRVIRPLQEWGNLVGEPDREPAIRAELSINVSVTNQTGTLPSGAQLVNSDTGVTYATLAPVLLDAPVITVEVRAVSDQSGGNGSGSIGNAVDGTVLQFANPIANVSRSATVTGTEVQGVDAEPVEQYRARIIRRFQRRPQGGAPTDYELWGLEAAGIINIYPYTGERAGEVDVYAEATPESSGDPDGIPTQAQLDDVLDKINFDEDGKASRRPINDFVNVYPITRVPFDVTVNGLQVDNPAVVQQQITDAVTQYFTNRAPYLLGLSLPPRRDRITESAVSGLVDDVVSGTGGFFDSVDLEYENSAISIYTLGIGEKAKLANIGFAP